MAFIEMIIESFETWLLLLVFPFSDIAIWWRMIPIYLNGLLSAIYSLPSNSGSVFAGVVALWAGADWIRTYMTGSIYATQLNWIIAIIFLVYGGLGLLVGILKKRGFYWFFRRTILTFFAISLYPIQMGYAPAESNLVLAIVVMAIPAIFVLEIFGFVFRRFILRTHTSSINSLGSQY